MASLGLAFRVCEVRDCDLLADEIGVLRLRTGRRIVAVLCFLHGQSRELAAAGELHQYAEEHLADGFGAEV